MHPQYRSDIDGLRAIAVASVVAYHYNLPILQGGFVGVDVFFVISGYLITSIIAPDVADGRFSFFDFYERRIRRILPALLAMLAIVLGLGLFLLLPSEMEEVTKSAAAAIFSFANMYFWSSSGYFASGETSRPLLHTWSLGVEEQFYIFYPPLLMAIARSASFRLKPTLIVLMLLSFAACVIQTSLDAPTAFYVTTFRAWELLAGGLIFLDAVPSIRAGIARNGVAAAGLGLVLLPMILIDRTTPFPGYWAALPVAGTAMLIHAGRGEPTIVGRFLSLKPIVFVGLVSYSWYLWHWPVWVFQQNANLFGVTGSAKLITPILMLISFALAVLSWRFVEAPFRSRRAIGQKALFAMAGSAVTVLTALCVATVAQEGIESRFAPEAIAAGRYLNYSNAAQFRSGHCFLQNRANDVDPACLRAPPGMRRYLILGDSHAAQLWYGLKMTYPDATFLQATATGCRPLLEAPPGSTDWCVAFQKRMLARIPSMKLNRILLAGRWTESSLLQLGRTLAYLKRAAPRVILVGPIENYDVPLPRLLAMTPDPAHAALINRHLVQRFISLDGDTRQIAERTGTNYLSLIDLLCGKVSDCPVWAQKGVPFQFDGDGHVTREGSILIARRMKAAGWTF